MTDHPHEPHAAHGDDHGHGSPFIAHHFDDAKHQFDAGKLGIWLFLAQEVLFFSALFVAYILYRHHHPEIYSYAHKYLDVKYGAINTGVLIFSSLTAAWAVRCAQLNQRRGLILCLAATIVCACGFLGIKYIEYSHKVHEHILFGRYFDPCVSSGGTELLTKNNLCAGTKSTVTWDYGAGTPGAGSCLKDIDQDPHKEGVQADCVVKEYALSGAKEKPTETFKREIKDQCDEESPLHELNAQEAGKKGGEETQAKGGAKAHAAGKKPCWRPAFQPAVCKKDVGILVEYGDQEEREELRIKAECKPSPKPADAGDLMADQEQNLTLGKPAIAPRHELTVHEQHELEAAGPPPEHTNMFFSIYFAMTGLHGVHVIFGIGVFTWLLIRAIKGQFSPDYFGPVDFAALYWHIVDLIWIFLFPLLYLIR
ncbi:MAG TPA: cytochrome c oxidase subunit 3 [Kofleriaceae bacterium]